MSILFILILLVLTMSDDQSDQTQLEMSPQELEKMEEAKLKAKYPAMPGGPGRLGGHSAFLQKRLAKGMTIVYKMFFC